MNTKSRLLRQLIREEVRRAIQEADLEPAQSGLKLASFVELALKKLKSNAIMGTIQKAAQQDTNKAQLISGFAEMIGVPKAKLPMIVTMIKKSAV